MSKEGVTRREFLGRSAGAVATAATIGPASAFQAALPSASNIVSGNLFLFNATEYLNCIVNMSSDLSAETFEKYWPNNLRVARFSLSALELLDEQSGNDVSPAEFFRAYTELGEEGRALADDQIGLRILRFDRLFKNPYLTGNSINLMDIQNIEQLRSINLAKLGACFSSLPYSSEVMRYQTKGELDVIQDVAKKYPECIPEDIREQIVKDATHEIERRNAEELQKEIFGADGEPEWVSWNFESEDWRVPAFEL